MLDVYCICHLNEDDELIRPVEYIKTDEYECSDEDAKLIAQGLMTIEYERMSPFDYYPDYLEFLVNGLEAMWS